MKVSELMKMLAEANKEADVLIVSSSLDNPLEDGCKMKDIVQIQRFCDKSELYVVFVPE